MDTTILYARHAHRFDRARTRKLMELPYFESAMALSPAPGGMLDLGCGSGEPIARHFVESGYHVTGVDPVAEMLEMSRVRFPEMTWHQADMRGLDIPGQFEIVIAWDSFFHLEPDDQRAMFATFHKYTAPGGALIFTSGPAEGEAVNDDWFGDVLYHASLDLQEYEALLETHGFSVVLHRVEDPDCGGHTVWVAQRHSMNA